MKYIFFLFVLFSPTLVWADVIFSEIAWMGTSDSQFEEWIELRNTGSEAVSLSGWKLYKAGGTTLLFSLSGEISGGEYLVVCRTTPSVTTPLSGGCDLSGSFGGSGLNNTSEHLVLKNNSGSTVEEVNAGGGWPAGSSSTKETMQKNGSSWITAPGTPGEANATSGTDTNDDDTENPPPDDEEEEVEEETTTTTSTASKTTKPTYTKRMVDIQVVDTSVPVGSPVKFSLATRDLKGANIYKGDFFWNMGDGTERFYGRNEKFEHTYEHPGTYVVLLKYYTTYFPDIEPEVTDKVTITVSDATVTISKVHTDGSIELKNTTSQEIDLSNWSLKDSSGKVFVIPEGTYLAGSKTLVLNIKRTGISGYSAMLFGPNGNLVTSQVVSGSTKTSSTSSSSSTSRVSQSSVRASSQDMGEDANSTINLNERLTANASSSAKQKQPSLWTIVFVCMLVGVSVLVFFLYRNKEKEKEPKEEDDFELID